MSKSKGRGYAHHLTIQHTCPRCARSFKGNVYGSHVKICADLQGETKTCRGCGERKPLSEYHKHRLSLGGRAAKCRACERIRKATRPRAYDPVKRRARSQLRIAMLAGRITKPEACEACGKSSAGLEAHHADYAKPLDVSWLCRSCHVQSHRTIPAPRDYYYGGKAL